VELIRRGDRGPAVAKVRTSLLVLGLLGPEAKTTTAPANSGNARLPLDSTMDGWERGQAFDDQVFDALCELALREFQQSRGLLVDGVVGPETWHALTAARWRLGDRALVSSGIDPMVGDDVHALQERLLELGYDPGRADGIFGPRTGLALTSFQREVGVLPDGVLGPQTMRALRQLGRRVVGGRPQLLRETAILHRSGPALVGKRIVIDPGHGGSDPGATVAGGHSRLTNSSQGGPVPVSTTGWSEADLTYDLATRIEARLTDFGVRTDLTRDRDTGSPDTHRAAFANATAADLLVSLHVDGQDSPRASGVASYYYGTGSGATSTVGERLANLVQREIVVRTGLLDNRIHAKTWELLRLTRMPAIRVEVGYLTSPADYARLIDPSFRTAVAEAVLVAIQRFFLPPEVEVSTGTLDVAEFRRTLNH
jgi:N-acetylmuramoyl-L-alanine amidase